MHGQGASANAGCGVRMESNVLGASQKTGGAQRDGLFKEWKVADLSSCNAASLPQGDLKCTYNSISIQAPRRAAHGGRLMLKVWLSSLLATSLTVCALPNHLPPSCGRWIPIALWPGRTLHTGSVVASSRHLAARTWKGRRYRRHPRQLSRPPATPPSRAANRSAGTALGVPASAAARARAPATGAPAASAVPFPRTRCAPHSEAIGSTSAG